MIPLIPRNSKPNTQMVLCFDFRPPADCTAWLPSGLPQNAQVSSEINPTPKTLNPKRLTQSWRHRWNETLLPAPGQYVQNSVQRNSLYDERANCCEFLCCLTLCGAVSYYVDFRRLIHIYGHMIVHLNPKPYIFTMFTPSLSLKHLHP